MLIELVNALIAQRVFPKEARTFFQTEYESWRNRKGAYDEYIMAVVASYLTHIKGVHYGAFKDVSKQVIEEQKHHVYRYTRDLIKKLKDDGYFLLAILDSFCKSLGFDKVYGRLYQLDEDDTFTGEIINLEEIKNKANILKRATEKENLTLENSVGVGDSIDDVSFLEMVAKPICFNPSKKLYEEAKRRNWNIVVERKNVIYEI